MHSFSTYKLHPYGMLMPGRHEQENAYEYGFNGMRKDDEIKGQSGTSYDFGARLYDSRVGRWLSQDPFSRLSVSECLYSFAGNSPILFIDYGGNYKLPAHQQEQYPKLTNLLKGDIQDVLANDKVMAALAKYGQMSKEEVAKALKWGSGPTIVVTDLVNSNGQFTPTPGSSEIRLDLGLVMKLENALAADEEAAKLLASSTILHETTHYGDNVDNMDYPSEEGQLFEEASYGMDVDNLTDAKSVISRTAWKSNSANIQRLGGIVFDSNKATKSTKNEGVLVVKDLISGKDYGVIRKDNGSYTFYRPPQNNSTSPENKANTKKSDDGGGL